MFLCACGTSSGAPSDTSGQASTLTSEGVSTPTPVFEGASEPAQSDGELIEFEDVVIIDDDVATVELTQFYERRLDKAGEGKSVLDKGLVLKVTNNTDGRIQVNLEKASINDDTASVSMENGNEGPEPGKTAYYGYIIRLKSNSEDSPLDTINDLYALRATIQTYRVEEKQVVDGGATPFSLAEIIEGGAATTATSSEAKGEASDGSKEADSSAQAASEGAEAEPLLVGDTVTTDDWEITYVGAELTDNVQPDNTGGANNTYEAKEGTVVLNLMFDVKRLSQEAGNLTDALDKGVATYAGKDTYSTVEPYFQGVNGVATAENLAVDPNEQLRINYLIVGIPEEAAEGTESMTVDIMFAGKKRSIEVK